MPQGRLLTVNQENATMRKTYIQPDVQVAQIKLTNTLLTGSPTPSNSLSITGGGDPIDGR